MNADNVPFFFRAFALVPMWAEPCLGEFDVFCR